MENLDDGTFLEASRHVPKLLRHQLLCHLTSNYLKHDEEQNHTVFSPPSLERFYGAVLFVDISGFTALSLKLDVESLKNHINDYFSKMLAVIEKWNGDVIKFAGDALYIVWPVQISELSNDLTSEPKSLQSLFAEAQFLEAARAAVTRATNCALEINYCCCHHKIIIGENVNPSKQRWTKLFNALPVLLGPSEHSQSVPALVNKTSTSITSNEKPTVEEDVAYLNVHSGIGFGLVAGVDIGGNDRWEYFLLGEPLKQCAEAESKAKMGELIVSDIAHGLFHDEKEYQDPEYQFGDVFNQELPCSCFLLEDRYFRVTCQPTASNSVRSGRSSNRTNPSSKKLRKTHSKKNLLLRSKSKNKLETLYFQNQQDEGDSKDSHQLEDLKEEIQLLVYKIYPIFKEILFKFIAEYKIDLLKQHLNNLMEEDEDDQVDDDVSSNRRVSMEEFKEDSTKVEKKLFIDPNEMKSSDRIEPVTFSSKQRQINTMIAKFIDKRLRPTFISWLQKCLVDDILRHTHEAPRKRHDYSQFIRVAAIHEFLQNHFFFHGNLSSILPGLPGLPGFKTADTRSVAKDGFSFPAKMLRQMSKAKSFVNDVGLSAELRTVTVLFINIHLLNGELMVEEVYEPSVESGILTLPKAHNAYSAFNFIQRSAREKEADLSLVAQLQGCMGVICNALFESGGQLRQFIVDDKGTVCIGTFGLRGSMAVDNAASAIECAKMIVIGLNEINLQASIGITTGKGYCGLVGSKFRHEYAVMGPSTNLSARLMGKARINQILCDTETRNRDRTHRFTALGAIKAKGYTDLVQTFMPVFEDRRYPGANNEESSTRAITRSSLDSIGIEHFLDQAAGESKKILNRSASGIASLDQAQPTQNNDISSLLLKELLNSTLTVQKRRGSLDYSISGDEASKGAESNPINEAGMIVSKLYGRSAEVEEIASFLILPFCRAAATADADIVAKSKDTSPQFKFDATTPARLMAVGGKEGFGKSSLVTAIARKLFMMSQTNRNCNLTVLKNRTNTVASTNPFQSIKSIIQELLIKFSKHSGNAMEPLLSSTIREESNHSIIRSNTANKRASLRVTNIRSSGTRSSGGSFRSAVRNGSGQLNTIEWQIRGGLQGITDQLSSDHQILLPLLSSYQIVKGLPDNEYASSLTGKAKLVAALDLICAIVELYCKVTGKVLFFVCEKLHLFDVWSLSCINQVWRHAKGIMVLCTYNPVVKDTTNAPGSFQRQSSVANMESPSKMGGKGMRRVMNGSVASSGPAPLSRMTSVMNMTSKEAGFDSDVFFHQYSEDPSRFKLLSLQLLDKESIQSITRDTVTTAATLRKSDLVNAANADLSEALMQKVYDMSGGNPLYATAIVNSVNLSEIAKINAENNAGNPDESNSQENKLDQLLLSATHRIGEVICYRFDQLDTLTQVVLKSAAVICSSQRAEFTLETLLFLMYDEGENHHGVTSKFVGSSKFIGSTSSSSDNEIINCLRSLLQNEEFIRLVDVIDSEEKAHQEKDPQLLKDSSIIDDEMISKGRFSFRVILEQITIYDLLVDEQKQQIHESVAIYYHQLIYFAGDSTPNIDHILAEAFHWEHAKISAYAVLCRNQAAVYYKHQGDYENMTLQLKIADEYHSRIRQEIGLVPLSEELSIENLLEVYEEYDVDVALQRGGTHHSAKSRFSENSTNLSPLQEKAPSMRLASGSEDTNDRTIIDKSKYLPPVVSLPHIPLIPESEAVTVAKSLSASHDEVEKTDSTLRKGLPEAPPSPLHVKKMKSVLPQQNNCIYNDQNAQLLFDMCLGDGEAFGAIISTQIMIAESYCVRFENPTLVLTILEDCLILLLLYHKYILMNIPNTTGISSKKHTKQNENTIYEDTEANHNDDESPKKLKRARTVRFDDQELDENTETVESKNVPPPLLKQLSSQQFTEKDGELEMFLVESFETYLCQVYAIYIWIVRQSPVGCSGGSWVKKSWYLCDRYLNLITQTTSLYQLLRSSTDSDAPGSPKSNKNTSVLQQKSKRFLSQKFLSFKNAPLSKQPSQTMANEAYAPSHLKGPFLNADKSQMRTKAHSVHSTCLYILLLIRDGQLSKAVKKCDRVLLSYSISKYSKTLIELYGFDITQYTMTMLCQELLLVGEIEKCFNYFTIIFENIYHLKDYYSIFLAYLPLFSVCVTLRKFSDAKKVLLLVEEYEKQTFHVQVFNPLIKLEMKSFLTMAKILWDDDDRERADEEQKPKQRDQEVNYYHRFLRNSFAKSDMEEGLLSMSTKQRKRFDELNELTMTDQSPLETSSTNEAPKSTAVSEADPSNTNPADPSTTNGLNDLASDDFLFLYENKEQVQPYFGYFLHQHGCAIESILTCVKLLQYFAQHQEVAAFTSAHVQEALKIFEQQYEAMIRSKSRYIVQNTEGQQYHCNVYSELISFSIFLSLYNDLQRQISGSLPSSKYTAVTPPLTSPELSLNILMELEQLLIQSERSSYSLPLAIFSESILTTTTIQQQLTEPKEELQGNDSPSSVTKRSPQNSIINNSSSSSSSYYCELAKRMKEKGYSHIQVNHNSSQLKGFEYLIIRMLTLCL